MNPPMQMGESGDQEYWEFWENDKKDFEPVALEGGKTEYSMGEGERDFCFRNAGASRGGSMGGNRHSALGFCVAFHVQRVFDKCPDRSKGRQSAPADHYGDGIFSSSGRKGDAAKMATHAGGAVGFFDASCETWACAGIVFELFLVCKDAFGRPKGWASGHSAALSGRV